MVTKYRGAIHTVIAGREYRWPCDCVETPSPGRGERPLLRVLGRAGLLDAFELCISGGYLTLSRRSRFRDWRKDLWRGLRSVIVAPHPFHDPI